MSFHKKSTTSAIFCSILGLVIFVVLVICAILAILFVIIPAIAIPVSTKAARDFDDKFKGGVCVYQQTVKVDDNTYYPEFIMYRKGKYVGTGNPFKHCGGGRNCHTSGDGSKVCERKLKYVNCYMYKTPEGQTAGKVNWNGEENQYEVGKSYSCELTESPLAKVSDQPGCTTWSIEGCVMMHRSNIPNAISDGLFWGLLIGFVFVPLGIAVASIFFGALSLIAFTLLGGFTWACMEGCFFFGKFATKTGTNLHDKWKNDSDKDDNNLTSLPPFATNSNDKIEILDSEV